MRLMTALRLHGQLGAAAGFLARPQLRRELDHLPTNGRPVVLSDEGISLRMDRFWSARSHGPERVARRIAALVAGLRPELRPCRILIGIRRQDRWLASCYAHCVDRLPRAGLSQRDFDQRLVDIAAGGTQGGALGWLDYTQTRNHFVQAFGAENVMMLPMERLISAPNPTLASLMQFLGEVDLQELKIGRPRSEIKRSIDDETWQLNRSGEQLTLRPELATAIRERFADSNRKLAAEMPLGFEP
jgi:hypothetical protein